MSKDWLSNGLLGGQSKREPQDRAYEDARLHMEMKESEIRSWSLVVLDPK